MGLTAIDEQIFRYEQRIQEQERENSYLRRKIDRLDEAHRGYQQKLEQFSHYLQDEQVKAERAQLASGARIAESYGSALHALCNGNHRFCAEDCFSGISAEIRKGKQRFEDEIHGNKLTIRNLESEIIYLKTRRNNLL